MGYLGFFRYDNVEIANEARVAAYTRSLGLSFYNCGMECPVLGEALAGTGWGDGGLYTTPSDDKAPWYDLLDPDSGDFGGVVILDATNVHESTYSTDVQERIQDGGVSAPGRRRSREMVFRALLVGKSQAACHSGLTWLTTVLINGDPCERTDRLYNSYLDIEWTWKLYARRGGQLIADNVYEAPLIAGVEHSYRGLRTVTRQLNPVRPLVGITDLRACLGNTLEYFPWCPDVEDPEARNMLDVVCVQAPRVLSEHVIPGSGCDAGAWMEVEFTLNATNPGIWRGGYNLRTMSAGFVYETFDPLWQFYKNTATPPPTDDDMFQAPLVVGQPQTYNSLHRIGWQRTAEVIAVSDGQRAEKRVVQRLGEPAVPAGLVITDPDCPVVPGFPPIPQGALFCDPPYTGPMNELTFVASAGTNPRYTPLAVSILLSAVEDIRNILITLRPLSGLIAEQSSAQLLVSYLPPFMFMYIDSQRRRADVAPIIFPGQDPVPIVWDSANHLILRTPGQIGYDYPEIVCPGDMLISVAVPETYDLSTLAIEVVIFPRDV